MATKKILISDPLAAEGVKILEDENISSVCKTQKKEIKELVKEVIRKSYQLKYWKWPCTWPKSIYENFAEVLNLVHRSKEDELDEYISTLGSDMQSKLNEIKKQREVAYPYKKPFANKEHLESFIKDIEDWKL